MSVARSAASRVSRGPYRVASMMVMVLAELASVRASGQTSLRPRARDVGVVIGVFQPGPLNAITDVAGVRVGQTTVTAGDSVHTGVTAVVPHGGNIFRDRVPAGVFVLNGFGKLVGSTHLQENGELETPILLTCTLCIWKAADAMTAYLLEQADMRNVRSINPVARRSPAPGYAGSFSVVGKWCCALPTAPSYIFVVLNSSNRPSAARGRQRSRSTRISSAVIGENFVAIDRFCVRTSGDSIPLIVVETGKLIA